MARVREPKNETYLAAELATVMPGTVRAAQVAVALCARGRVFKRLSEKLCGGEEVWGPWSEAVAKAQARAKKTRARMVTECNQLLCGLPAKVEVSRGSGLILECRTQANRGKGVVPLVTALL